MPKRRYSKVEKVAAMVAADASSTTAASERTGIPRKTIAYWLDSPEFADIRQNAREGMAEDALYVARLAWKKLGQAIAEGKLEPRDLVIAVGMATDKSQLLFGKATNRVENVSVTDGLDDAEREALSGAIQGELARRADELAAEAPVGLASASGAEGT